MQLYLFTILAAVAFVVAYALGANGADSALVFLTILFAGAALRVAKPLIDRLRRA